MKEELPFVSVIIVNRNGMDFIDNCLNSVLKSNYPKFEVIFIDGASTDGSLEHVQKTFKDYRQLKIIGSDYNCGPASDRNRGASLSKGKYLIFLDNDTEVNSDWINELVDVLEHDASIGAAQAKLLRLDTDKLYDCAGDYLGPLGFLIERSRSAKDNGQFDFIADILSAKSAASIIRKDLFNKIGGFDESYFMYLEETDLSWRVWLSGFRVVFIPQAVVYHAFNTPKKDRKHYYSKFVVRYYGCRNYISTLIKNLGFINLIKILPFHIACWLLLSFFFILKGNLEDAFYIIKGVGWNFLNIGILLNKRRYINHKIRVTSDDHILNKVMARRRTEYYLGKALAYVRGRSF